MSSRLSSLLVQDGLVSAKRVADALQRQVIHGGTLDSNLLEIKALDEDTLIACLGRAFGLPTQPTGIVSSGLPRTDVLELFSADLAERFHAVPTTLLPAGVLRVLVTSEVEMSDMDALALLVKQRIEPWVVLEFRFAEAMEKIYGRVMVNRFARLLSRSVAAHEGQGKPWPAPRLIDPIPRFGSLSDLRIVLSPLAEPTPASQSAKESEPAQAEVAPPVSPETPAGLPEKREAEAASRESEIVIPPAVAAVAVEAAVPVVVFETAVPVAVVEPAAPVAVVEPAAPVAVFETAVPVAVVELAAPVAVVEPAVPVAVVELAAPVGPIEPAAIEAVVSVAVVEPVAPVAAIEPAVPAVTESIASIAPATIEEPVKMAPAAVDSLASLAQQSDQSQPRTIPSSPNFSGIPDISLDEWMSAADWLSAANKVPPPAEPASPMHMEKPVEKSVPTAPPSSASPNKRKGKRKDGKEPVAAFAKPAAAVSPKAKPAKAPAATPAAAALAPAALAPPAEVAASLSVKPSVAGGPVFSASEALNSVPAIELAAPSVDTTSVDSARTPETPPPSFSETSIRDAVPELIDSGRLGEPLEKVAAAIAASIAAAPASIETAAPTNPAPEGSKTAAPTESAEPPVAPPPPSADSPEPATEIGPPPRIAVALDETGASPLSLEAARELVGVANERDAIFEAVCRGVRSRAAFVAVFTLHGDVAFGRMALGETWLDRQAVGRISVPLDRPSSFRVVAKGRSTFMGMVGAQAAVVDPLLALGRRPPIQAAVLPILVRGRPVALVYLDDDGRELPSALMGELQPLLSEVGQTFQRLVQLSKTGGIGATTPEVAAPEEVKDTGTSALRPRENRIEVAAPQPASFQPTVRLAVEQPATPAAPAPEKPAAEEAAPSQPLSVMPTVPISQVSPRAVEPPKPEPTPAKTTASTGVRSSGRAGRGAGRSHKSPPTSVASPPTSAVSPPAAVAKEPIATIDLDALIERAATSPLDRAALREILAIGASAVPGLLERLRDANTSARARHIIILCLAEMPVQAAIDPLGERLFDRAEEVRGAAATALRNFPPSMALSTLRGRLRDALDGGDAKGVQQAAEALGELRDVQAVPQLIELLDHRDPLLVDAVGRALQAITKQDFGRSRFRWNGWWRRHQAEPRLQWLLAGLCHPSAVIRATAQDELLSMSGDVASYRYDQPRDERDVAVRRWVNWWQAQGFDVI